MKAPGLAMVVLTLVSSASPAVAQTDLDLRGFRPGSSLAEAQEHATADGLKLSQMSALPTSWIVEGTNLTLAVCDGNIDAVYVKVEGGVDEFADLVSSWTTEFGPPAVQIISVDAGATRISNIDARFTIDGETRLVQLSSAGGKVAINASVGSNIECSQTSVP